MVLNTFTVGAAVTPSVIETAISHYIHRKPLRGKPTAHISYDEGLHLVRQFLEYASHHTVDEVQAFTAQWVPSPRWVKTEEITIPDEYITRAASTLAHQLGPKGIEAVGGSKWWQWRPEKHPLKAEWIEMRKEYNARKAAHKDATRVILYVHGGAYFFGSVDEHRYQLQRHARKLKARLLAPRYRLAPQFPFPCGLQDAVAAYLFLLKEYDASSILVAGDSAGGGMTISLLVTLRDQGIPLPAGALLLSPWVDLTHSFPSVSGEGLLDYIPPNGFHHRPSMAWPPPNDDEMRELRSAKYDRGRKLKKHSKKQEEDEAVLGARVEPTTANATSNSTDDAAAANANGSAASTVPTAGPNLSIDMDGKHIEILDQIQMYSTNQLLTHPLVSPVMQPSLGGLPPLLIQTGGGELLCDEQVYLAHKAANPTKYRAPESILDLWDPDRKIQDKYPPTKVQLQVWEDLCHVPHTLSFTRPAKYMYRAVAQFGNWCYANSTKDTAPQQDDDDALSVISSDTDSDTENLQQTTSHKTQRSMSDGGRREPPSSTANGTGVPSSDGTATQKPEAPQSSEPLGTVGANDPLPPFEDHMIRQLVDRHGTIFPLAPAESLPGCTIPRTSIGVIKPGPVRKWLAKKQVWDRKFASQKLKVQRRRAAELRDGYETFAGETEGASETPPPTALAGRRTHDRRGDMPNLFAGKKKSWGLAMWSGWGSKHDTTTVDAERSASVGAKPRERPGRAAVLPKEGDKIPGTDHTFLAPGSVRPHDGTVAYPFKLKSEERSASTTTLEGAPGVVDEKEERPGVERFKTAKEEL